MSINTACLRQKRVLKDALDKLDTSPGMLISKLHDLRKLLVTPTTSFVHMATNVKQLTEMFGPKAAGVWRSFYDGRNNLELTSETDMAEKYPIYSEYASRDSDPEFRHAIVNLGTSGECIHGHGSEIRGGPPK